MAVRNLSHLLRKPKEVDQHALDVKRARATEAHALLENEMLKEAFDRVEGVYMQAWRGSDPFATETRERSWIAVQLLSDLKNSLIAVVRDGEAATAQLKKLAES
jgi:hypothetical protein